MATNMESPGQKDPEETHPVLGSPIKETEWGQKGEAES